MTDYPTTWWEICGETEWQPTPGGGRSRSTLFRRIGTSDVGVTYDELPVGALWAADRSHCKDCNQYPPAGADGLAVVCKTIDASWNIDSRASNCTMKEENWHRCWVRHGTVGDKLTVDKNGKTCCAGAGSFYMDHDYEKGRWRWHGFLRDGVMVQG